MTRKLEIKRKRKKKPGSASSSGGGTKKSGTDSKSGGGSSSSKAKTGKSSASSSSTKKKSSTSSKTKKPASKAAGKKTSTGDASSPSAGASNSVGPASPNASNYHHGKKKQEEEEGGVSYPDQVFLKLSSTWPSQKPPRQQPVHLKSSLQFHAPFYVRFGYAHSYATAGEISERMRRDGVKAKKVIVGPSTSDYEVVARLHNNDLKTMRKIFASPDPKERIGFWRVLADAFQRLDIRIPVAEDLEKYEMWKDAADIWKDEKPNFPRHSRRPGRGRGKRRGGGKFTRRNPRKFQ